LYLTRLQIARQDEWSAGYLPEYEEMMKQVPFYDDFIMNFESCQLSPNQDPFLVAQKVANDGKWSE